MTELANEAVLRGSIWKYVLFRSLNVAVTSKDEAVCVKQQPEDSPVSLPPGEVVQAAGQHRLGRSMCGKNVVYFSSLNLTLSQPAPHVTQHWFQAQ